MTGRSVAALAVVVVAILGLAASAAHAAQVPDQAVWDEAGSGTLQFIPNTVSINAGDSVVVTFSSSFNVAQDVLNFYTQANCPSAAAPVVQASLNGTATLTPTSSTVYFVRAQDPISNGASGCVSFPIDVSTATSTSSTTAPSSTTTVVGTTPTTAPTSNNIVGTCSGFQFVAALTPPLAGDGTATATTAALKTAKNGLVAWGVGFSFAQTATGTGSCTLGTNTYNDVAIAAKLSGTASCNTSSTDSTLHPLNGKLKLTMSSRSVVVQSYVRVDGFDPAIGPDVISITGIVTKGATSGALVHTEVSFDPVLRTLTGFQSNDPAGNPVTVLKGQYYFDNSQVATPCGSGPTAPPITLVWGGDGTSLLGTTIPEPALTLSY
jgi:hypothetical protein